MPQLSILERAFQLARGGQCRTIDEIRTTLSREGYEAIHTHLGGATIGRQLKEAIAAAK